MVMDKFPNSRDNIQYPRREANEDDNESEEEFDELDSYLDELNGWLDYLEKKNDEIHDQLWDLLQKSRLEREEFKKLTDEGCNDNMANLKLTAKQHDNSTTPQPDDPSRNK